MAAPGTLDYGFGMLICEEIFLLLTNDKGGVEGMSSRGCGVTAGVVTDLLQDGRIALTSGEKPELERVDTTSTGDPVLDATLPRLAERTGKKLSDIVQDSKAEPVAEIVHRLAARGIIEVDERRLLGISRDRYPVVDRAPEAALRERLRRVLAGEQAPGPTDGPVLAILEGLGALKSVLKDEVGDLKGKALTARVEQIAAETPAADAVEAAMDQLMSVVMTAAIIPAVTSTST